MGLFQKSIIKKHLNNLNNKEINEAYSCYQKIFSKKRIEEIKKLKEEEYQDGFLDDLFVNVFKYIKRPADNYNLQREFKNKSNSQKADGAILKNGEAVAVIELKGTNTRNLDKIQNQAFSYKNNQPNCNYVITSNFEKLRFYIDNSVDFEEFNLFNLTRDRFELLWLCLFSNNLLNDLPKQIKNESLSQEENITKKLYKEYSSFRNEIFINIQNENPEYDKLTLFKKTKNF